MKAILFLLLGVGILPSLVFAQDPGTQTIGRMKVELIYAFNNPSNKSEVLGKKLDDQRVKELQKMEKLSFSQYILLGSDLADILNGYEGWATPIKPSKEILVSFQPMKKKADSLQVVLEYWQSKKKVLTMNPTLTLGKPFYLLGPNWREGRVILAIEIVSLES